MLKFLKAINEPLQELLMSFYHAKKKTSDGGETITTNEAEEILEKARDLFVAIEGEVRALRQ